jgi:bacillithiol biosynthesis cysteine-adding enzyme BshC
MCCLRSDYRGRVNSHCFPFRQVPHSTRLFLDYLEHSSPARQFFPRSPRFHEWVKDESARIDYPANRREQLARILERQNKSFGASPGTLENIAAFRSGASAIVTGQQVGLFGGPAFSIYKALSAIRLAKDAQNLGVDCVPIFWLATEDHDLHEVNQIRIPAADATLETLATTARAAEDAPVGTISFGPEISDLVLRVENLLGESEITKLVRECYRPGETFGTSFAKLFARIFAGFGVILLDGSDPELDQIAAPLYGEVIERSPELNHALLHRDEELHAAGYHQQVRITSSSTPLFVIRSGSRVPVHAAAGKFLIGDEEVSQQELLQLANSSPQTFSPNVLLRPVVQDYLLPTLAYVGGSAEVAYFAQAAAAYQSIQGRVTPIVPRFSTTLVEPKPQALLERYQLSFSDLFHGPEALRERIGSHLLGPNLQSSFQQAKTAVERSMIAVREALTRVDKTLVESAQNAESKMLYQLTNLQSRAARAELRHSEVADRHARFLSNTLYPDKTLQEREVAGIYFLAKHGRGLLEGLLGTINSDCVDHQLVTL